MEPHPDRYQEGTADAGRGCRVSLDVRWGPCTNVPQEIKGGSQERLKAGIQAGLGLPGTQVPKHVLVTPPESRASPDRPPPSFVWKPPLLLSSEPSSSGKVSPLRNCRPTLLPFPASLSLQEWGGLPQLWACEPPQWKALPVTQPSVL